MTLPACRSRIIRSRQKARHEKPQGEPSTHFQYAGKSATFLSPILRQTAYASSPVTQLLLSLSFCFIRISIRILQSGERTAFSKPFLKDNGTLLPQQPIIFQQISQHTSQNVGTFSAKKPDDSNRIFRHTPPEAL